ncbi:MAG: hypothetical protein ACK55I_03170, partial [bacterium]
KNTQTARLAKPAEPPDRPGQSPTHSQAKASRRMSAGTPEVAAARRKSRERGSDADSGGRAATPVARCAALYLHHLRPGKLRSRLEHQRERLPAGGPAVDNLSSSRRQPGNSGQLLAEASVSR